jgi:Family of unknown function (DUF5682)
MHAALGLHAQGPLGAEARGRWMTALAGLDGRRDVHGLVAGRVVRLLADGGVLSPQQAAVRFAAALSAGVPPAGKAQWAEGFLSGGAGSGSGGLLLVHDRELLAVLDTWVGALGPDEFDEVLPLLRRTFGEFTAPERASVGRAVRGLRAGTGAAGGSGAGVATAEDLDTERARGAVRTVAAILGGGAGLEGAA